MQVFYKKKYIVNGISYFVTENNPAANSSYIFHQNVFINYFINV